MKAIIWIITAEIFSVYGTVLSRGGYDGIVLAINEDILQPLDCQAYLDRIERSFTEASSILHTATDRRVFFRSVTVLLPSRWSDCSELVETASGENYDSADFRIDLSSPLFGDALYSQQSKGCGKRGDFVKIPRRFFDEDGDTVYGPRGKALVHEWAKVRYGVFDEFGFPGDRLYPTFYETNEIFSHSGCSNEPVRGTLTCDPATSNDCQLIPGGDNSKVTSSLMYMHYLDKVGEFCSNVTHNRFAPTMQNILCEGVSTRDVIFRNSDLLNATTAVNATRSVAFTYKRATKTRFILAIDVSSDMGFGDRYAFVRRSLRRFILKDLPTGSEVGLVTFSDSAMNLTLQTVALTDETKRKNLFNLLPQDASTTTSKCILCALNSAIQVLEAGGRSAAGHSLIIITTPLSAQDTLDSIENTVDVAKQKKLRVSVIGYAGTFNGHTFLTAETNGYQGIVRPNMITTSESNLGMLTQLSGELLAALSHQAGTADQGIEIPIVIHEKSSDATSIIRGTFTIDVDAGRDTIFAVYFYDLSRPGVNRLMLTSPNGTLYSSLEDTELGSSYYTTVAPINQAGIWNYSVERDSSIRQPHIVRVTTRQYATSTPKLSIRVYSSLEALEGDVNLEPIKLFAEVKFGRQSVLQAQVTVSITSNNGTRTVELFDNGNGDPDITSNDGIYSRYLTEISGSIDSYSVKVTVVGESGVTYTVKDTVRKGPKENERPKRSLAVDPVTIAPCCGSSISIPLAKREYIPPFLRMAQGPLIKARGYASSLSIPPRRISDFKVQVNKGTANWTFTWIAPGDDMDRNRAYTYELRYSYSITDLSEEKFTSLNAWPVPFSPSLSGEPETLTGNFDSVQPGIPVYFAIKAIDYYGNKGRMSNIAEAFRAHPVVTTTPDGGETPPNPPLLSDAAIAGIAVGSALALGLILLVIIICLKRRKHKETQYKKNLNGTSLKKEIIPEKLENERKGSISVIPTTNDPIHWTASQLLQEHEKRHRNSTYEPAFNPENPQRYASSNSVNVGYDPYSGGSRSPSDFKIAPPTLPKPKRPASQLGIPFAGSELGSQSSLASDKRKRNITQV